LLDAENSKNWFEIVPWNKSQLERITTIQ